MALAGGLTMRAMPPRADDVVHDLAVQAAAARAVELIEDGARVGLGSGRAAASFIAQLGARVRQGLRVVGVPTSHASARQAREVGIPLTALGTDAELDLTVDGADEVAPNLDLLKGRGGALVRERIVAAASRRQVIVVGSEKLVQRLGERGPIPIEVIPFALSLVLRWVNALGFRPEVRCDADSRQPSLTENGNATVDCTLVDPLDGQDAARGVERMLRAIPGVVDTGLFLGTAERVLVGHPDGRVDELHRQVG
jgi:ribose 5-phosphate isomerase A